MRVIQVSSRLRLAPIAGKIIGLDVGTLNVGVAISDSRRRIAFPVGAFRRAGALREDVRSMDALLRKHGHDIRTETIEVAVLGVPELCTKANMATVLKNSESEGRVGIREFIKSYGLSLLSLFFEMQRGNDKKEEEEEIVIMHSEDYSSTLAREGMGRKEEWGGKKKRRKKGKDRATKNEMDAVKLQVALCIFVYM